MSEELRISKEDVLELVTLLVGQQEGDFIKIQELPIDDQGKYQHESTVFLYVPSGKFYIYSCSRSGSYFSDYNWEYGEDKEGYVTLYRVRITPMTVFQWEKVK